ncbi:hypothetical protein [Rahnella sp. PAMC 25559]|uniref:hypothetical protein n=1 Tax=Rahnella sp. PAMC 25559 TaxID=3423225 RepID=UPI003D67F490
MAKAFDFQLTADDRVSESIQSIDDAVKKLLPQLNNARTGLQLGGRQSSEGVDEISERLGDLAKNAKDGVQFIGDLVPPLKMVGGLTLGLGGLASVFNAVKSGIQGYANAGYKIDTTAKNISTTTRAYQELTGAMIENGSARDAAEGSVSGLYQRANDALNMRDDGFLALTSQLGIKISKTKEGVADVAKLMDDLNKVMLQQSPARQALIAQVGGFSPELLSFLRQSTDQVQKLKDQAQRDGLIFSDKDVQNALAFRNQLNHISASWDGLLMKAQVNLGKDPTIQGVFDSASQVMQHGFDTATVGSLMDFNSGGKQADRIREALKDEKFKKTLSWDEKLDLNMGYASGDLVKKLNSFYGPTDKAKLLQQDVKGLYVQSPYSPDTNSPPMSYNQSGGGNARGIRNNNPGNLRVAPNAVGNDGAFAVFDKPDDGLAAMSRQLQLYGDRGNNTPYGIIHTYAPSSENNTQAYINAITGDTGYGAHEQLDLSDPATLKRMMAAMIRHENGSQPYSEKDIDSGINQSMTDPKWQGLRDPTRLAYQRDQYSDWLINGPSSPESASINQPAKADGTNINAPATGSPNGAVLDTQKLGEVISTALKDSKSEIEVTLINGRTGERKKVSGSGGKVTTAMSPP